MREENNRDDNGNASRKNNYSQRDHRQIFGLKKLFLCHCYLAIFSFNRCVLKLKKNIIICKWRKQCDVTILKTVFTSQKLLLRAKHPIGVIIVRKSNTKEKMTRTYFPFVSRNDGWWYTFLFVLKDETKLHSVTYWYDIIM
jgi:hypothetical protein